MKHFSLRLRLMIFFIVISLGVFATAGFLSWKECQEKIDEFFDTYQIALARRLSTANWNGFTPETQKISDEIIDDINNAEDEDESIGFAVFSNDGKQIFNDGENGRYFSPFGKMNTFGTEEIDDEDWRIIRLMTTDKKYIVAVGQELDFRHEIVEDMFEEFMTPWVIGLVILLLTMILLLTKEFSSLNRLASHVKNRKADDLSCLEETNLPLEVKPLITSINQLLSRIEDMLHRERNFIADSAHELRSPLTALKVQLEVAQMSADDPQSIKESLEKLEQGIERSSHLVEQLLAFSRIESGFNALPDNNHPLDWALIINQVVSDYTAAAEKKSITIRTEITDTPPFDQGNPVWIALMIKNLIDNAIKYSPRGAGIFIRLKDKELTVLNTQTTVFPDHLKHLGERFYRPAGQKEQGSGLGLSIISKIASVYHCKTEYKNTAEGFCVTLKNH